MKTIILWAVLDVHLATLSEILTCPTRLVQIPYNAPHHRAQWYFTRALTKLTMACSQHVCVHKYIKYLHNSSSVSGGQVYEMEPVLCNGVGVLFFEMHRHSSSFFPP